MPGCTRGPRQNSWRRLLSSVSTTPRGLNASSPRLWTADVGDLLQVVRGGTLPHLVRRSIIEPGTARSVLNGGFSSRETALARVAAAAVFGPVPAGHQ
jgi:hypothetical protein